PDQLWPEGVGHPTSQVPPDVPTDFMSRFNELPEGVPEVIDAIMGAIELMQQHSETVTIGSLRDGFSLAMGGGHEMAEVLLSMAIIAIGESKPVEAAPPAPTPTTPQP